MIASYRRTSEWRRLEGTELEVVREQASSLGKLLSAVECDAVNEQGKPERVTELLFERRAR